MKTRHLVIILAFILHNSQFILASDWPQLQRDPQRTGFTPDEAVPPLKALWTHNFQPERVSRQVQPVVYKGRVFVATYNTGTMHAFDVANGAVLWQNRLGSPVCHTAACEDDLVVTATLDGRIHALAIESGKLVWIFAAPDPQATFTQAPLIAEKKVFIASRQGMLFAINLKDGKELWRYNFQVPVCQTAAYNDGKVYLGGEDIKIRAISAADGNLLWTSEPLYGQSLKEYHPVAAGGYVMVRPMIIHPARRYTLELWGSDPAVAPDNIFQSTWSHFYEWTGIEPPKNQPAPAGPIEDEQTKVTPFMMKTAPDVLAGKMPEFLMQAQDAMIEHYKEYPYDQDFFVLNETDGKQAYIAPHLHLFSLPGPVCPPCLTASGDIVFPWAYITHCWARFDLKKQRVVEIMVPPRMVNGDETHNVSVGGKFLYALHCKEIHGAGYSGVFDFEKKKWHDFPGGVPKRHWRMTDDTESGNAAGSISDGRLFHVVFHQIGAFGHDDNK